MKIKKERFEKLKYAQYNDCECSEEKKYDYEQSYDKDDHGQVSYYLFRNLMQRFTISVKVDKNVNDAQTKFDDSSFINGLYGDTMNDCLKDLQLPENCDALVQGIWRLLRASVRFVQNLNAKHTSTLG